MDIHDFEKMKHTFAQGNVDEKIEIYVNAEDLTQQQYRELLRMFPLEELGRLETALEAV